jgi:hypothetical protein
MTEIQNTNFVSRLERHDMSIPPDAPYTLFEPAIEHTNPDGSVERIDRDTVLKEMKDYATSLGSKPGRVSPFGGSSQHTVGEIIDTRASGFLEEQNTVAPAPEAMIGVLTTIAQLAERSGFDRDKATFQGAFLYEREVGNPNLTPHSDGLSGIVEDDTEQAKTTRFVYALGPGTLIYPGLDKEGRQIQVDYDSPAGFSYVENPTPNQVINNARSDELTQEELMTSDVQQVVPGVVLGFDPTRTFWHQAHDEPRPILVVDVKQVS